ncbi:MAG TPA: NAD(P)-dependent oxidoreductase, partial [Terriglobales bacterium]|nr:NAD(P)-dependent oxidoreductase [Terriglobales bacterium]
MKLLIALHHRFDLWCDPPWFAPRLAQEFPQLTIARTPDYDHVATEIADADIMLGWSLRPEQFRLAKKLRWIHSTAAAVHQLMSPELIASDVMVTNARAVHGPVVAEHAIALIFAMAKRLPAAAHYQAKKIWAQEQLWQERPAIREVAGSMLTLIGVGSIGREIIQCARPLGMRVLAVREHPERGAEGTDEVFGMDQLDGALAQADFVVIAAPLTPRTQGM